MIDAKDKIIFLTFLKDKNAFRQYVRNMQNLSIQSPNYFFEHTSLCDAIAGAFTWYKTPEGTEFWCQLDKSWLKHISSKCE